MANCQQIHYQNIRNRSLCSRLFHPHPPYTDFLDRTIITNLPDNDLPTNRIETSHYNLLTFIPINLIQQFTKPSNLYFLLIGIMQIIPNISVSDGKPTMFFPLSIILLVSMIKDFVQDWKRRISDSRQNNMDIQLLTKQGYLKVQWHQLKVGNIIKIHKQQYFPCDVLVLSHDQSYRVAYIETKNLDGETNLKLRTVHNLLAKQLQGISMGEMANLKMKVQYEKPNPFLSTFTGTATLANKTIVLSNENIVLRGCSLRTNDYLIGLCLYTGHQTKILLNSGRPQPKRSNLQSTLNQYFKWVFCLQLFVTFTSAIGYSFLLHVHPEVDSYIKQQSTMALAALFAWGSWFISFSNFIPISMLVTVDLVRWGQGILLNKDPLCCSQGIPAQVQTSSVNEQLGQISYILSDKTGTLTRNVMNFRFLTVNGNSYGDNHNFIDSPPKKPHILPDNDIQDGHIFNQQPVTINQQCLNQSVKFSSKHKSQYLSRWEKLDHVDFSEIARNELLKDIQDNQYGDIIKQGLLHLSICHNVIVDQGGYSSSSPDQLALVNFAKLMGFHFLGRNQDNLIQICQNIQGELSRVLQYQPLHVLEFSSQRRRMSVIVKRDNLIMLLTKGADEVLLPRLAKTVNNEIWSKTKRQLHRYASKGLRTLLLARRIIPQTQYQQWNQKYEYALTNITSERLSIIQKLQSQLQISLQLIGVTAVQDQLQDQVKSTIQLLQDAGIKVWMLTGDKLQTAISIGNSCGLIKLHSKVIKLQGIVQKDKLIMQNIQHEENSDMAIVITGEALKVLKQQCGGLLEGVMKKVNSVVCCRVSPKEKEEVTSIAKQWGITLAIGDGANDTNMINRAHVGVGVRGIEGSQATRAADFVIGQFRVLRRLLLFHGLNFYHRNSMVMLYTIYKNLLLALPILLYGPFSLQSALFCYDQWVFLFFNVLYVSLPILHFGHFDTAYPYLATLSRPSTYHIGQQNSLFNMSILFYQLLQTTLYSFLLIIFIYYPSQSILISSGQTGYQQWSGMCILSIIIISCNLRILILANQFYIVQALLCLFGIGMFYLVFYLVSRLLHSNDTDTLGHLIITPYYWLFLVFLTVIINCPLYLLQKYKRITSATTWQQLLLQDDKENPLEGIRQQMQQIDKEQQEKSIKHSGGYVFSEDQNRFKILTPIN